mmetsp:Transcript_15452/g.22670  ORF Transcript_15452/g.22670 Transcript_15452/m.22670 type:complete len:98 (+) Transcript_15452:884-1177(+)
MCYKHGMRRSYVWHKGELQKLFKWQHPHSMITGSSQRSKRVKEKKWKPSVLERDSIVLNMVSCTEEGCFERSSHSKKALNEDHTSGFCVVCIQNSPV